MSNYTKGPSGHKRRILTVTLTQSEDDFAPVQLGPADSLGNQRIITSWSDTNHLRIDSDNAAAYDITGLAAFGSADAFRGLDDGTEVTITILATAGISFPPQSNDSLEANRYINDGSFQALLADSTFTIWYDATTARWRFPQKVTA